MAAECSTLDMGGGELYHDEASDSVIEAGAGVPDVVVATVACDGDFSNEPPPLEYRSTHWLDPEHVPPLTVDVDDAAAASAADQFCLCSAELIHSASNLASMA